MRAMNETATTQPQSQSPSDIAVDARPQSSFASRALERVVIAASLCFAVVTLTYAPRNIEPNSLTDSWLCVLHRAFVQHAVWGRDIVFTYGPWGFVFGGTRSETLAWWLAARLLLAGTCWYAMWRINARVLPRPILRAASVCIPIAIIAWGGMDLQIMIVPFLLLVIGVRHDRDDRALLVMLCLAAGLCGWIKHSAGLIGAAVVAVVTLTDLMQRRRPLVLLIYLLASLGFFLLARQPLGALPDYVRNNWEIMIGYGPGMQASSLQAPRAMSFYLASVVVLLAILALGRTQSRGVTLLVCIVAAVWFEVIFKESFVRQDQDPHMEIAAPAVLLVLLILVAHPSSRRRTSALLAVVGLALGMFTANSIHRHDYVYGVSAISDVLTKTPRHAYNFISMIGDLFRRDAPAIASDEALPPLKGPFDAIPWTGPYGFDQLKPRPVFQSYSVYTPRLAELNARFLQRDDAPPTLLWRVDPLAPNYATMEDPLIWPEALAHYRYAGDAAGQLILSRKPDGSYRLVPIAEVTTTIGVSVEVPRSKTGCIWLKMHVAPTRAGQLRSVLYRPVELHLMVETDDGATVSARLCVPILSCGFLLSPELKETSDFKNLIENDPRNALAPRRVKRICVTPAEPGSFLGYDEKLAYKFFDLETN